VQTQSVQVPWWRRSRVGGDRAAPAGVRELTAGTSGLIAGSAARVHPPVEDDTIVIVGDLRTRTRPNRVTVLPDGLHPPALASGSR
jgi:hypothetical protein